MKRPNPQKTKKFRFSKEQIREIGASLVKNVRFCDGSAEPYENDEINLQGRKGYMTYHHFGFYSSFHLPYNLEIWSSFKEPGLPLDIFREVVKEFSYFRSVRHMNYPHAYDRLYGPLWDKYREEFPEFGKVLNNFIWAALDAFRKCEESYPQYMQNWRKII